MEKCLYALQHQPSPTPFNDAQMCGSVYFYERYMLSAEMHHAERDSALRLYNHKV